MPVRKDGAAAGGETALQYRLIAAQAYPWQHSFTTLLRYLAARHAATMPSVGKAVRPSEEPFRLGQQPTLTFASREIAHVELKHTGAHISLFSLGMLGPNGPLPIHFTEIAKDRLDNRHDATLVKFLDIFHHRAMTHQYRAWAQSQSAAGLDRADDEGFSRYVGRLAGNDPVDIGFSPLPSHARMAASAHLVRESRNPDGLAATLAHYFGVPVRIGEHMLHWISVAPEEHTRLGVASVAAVMGEGALAGEMVPDRQHKFRIVIGPLSLSQYLRFTPNGRDLPILVEWVRAFVGFEYVWDVELIVKSKAAPGARIGAEERLGWSTWLGDGSTEEAVTGMIFEPEQYVHPNLNIRQKNDES
ncbi:type VI secretion system baseplate subunit TssG [Collimonas silvisoli]|uniref:type VI secretion system baseplate subunit TssG n=1 Tax=Collimonas silvisoli TaxID=2825884 RepID=UPI001B8C5E7A|nr:type VI secretion system baseplate subunit TssG [Collimonas silvisoli]